MWFIYYVMVLDFVEECVIFIVNGIIIMVMFIGGGILLLFMGWFI